MYRCTNLLLIAALFMLPVAAAADNATQLTLEQAVAIAVRENPEFMAAGLGIKGAEHRQNAARADFFPKAGTSYTYVRLTEPPRMKLPPGELSPQKINIVVGTQNRYDWNLHLVQPLFTGGAIYNTYRLEKLGVDVARLKRDIARNDLIYSVKAAYFTVLKAQKLQDIARQAVEQIGSHEKTAQAFFEQEMIAKNDLLDAQVRRAQAEQNLVRAEQGIEIAKAMLNSLLHRDVNTPVFPADMSDVQPLSLALEDSQSLAVRQQPLIREIDMTIEQARTGVKLAESSYFPKAYLISSYSRQGNQADVRGTAFEDSESWNVGVSLDWTFWEWGKKGNNVGEQKVLMLQAREAKKAVTDMVLLQVKDAWLRCREHWKNLGVSRTAIDRAEENFRMYQNRFNQQMATTTDVLDAQTLLTQAHANYNSALYDYLNARAFLENAVAKELQ